MSLSTRLNELSTQQLTALLSALHGPAASSRRKALVAYYVPDSLSENMSEADCHIIEGIAESTLISQCSDHLTAQQTPVRFVALNKLPTLPNGKLAYAKLPTPKQLERAESSTTGEASDVTLELVAILSELLGMDDVRPDDNFFEIGGDSITAIQFVSKARDAGVQLDVAAISQSSTIEAMARNCESVSIDKAAESKTAAKPQSQFAASGLDDSELDDFLQSFD